MKNLTRDFIFLVLITNPDDLTCKICDFGSSRFGIQTTKMTITGVTNKNLHFLNKILILPINDYFKDISLDESRNNTK